MSIFDSLDSTTRQGLYSNTIDTGDVFLKKFDEAEHEKMFIVTGISKDKIFICSIFINSKIHSSLANKPEIYKLQIPLLKKRNSFLKHDSFANCSFPIAIKMEDITKDIMDKICKVIGSINTQDLGFIQNAIISSGLLSEEEVELYFQK